RHIGGRLPAIAGSVPTLGDIPVGCPFSPRCALRFEPCGAVPALVPIEPEHGVRCFLYSGKAE
ncbi:MAG: oligopeptide/dipeptide ABC transporter ATP-binding protein, partial [Acidobacteriota bacterium]